MARPKKNQHNQSYESQVERKRALSGDSSLLVHATVGEVNDADELFSSEAQSATKPFILASSGERNILPSSADDSGFLAKGKEGRSFKKIIMMPC